MSRFSARLLAYMRLCRLPNVFTAIADVMMGYLFVHQGLTPVVPFFCLVAATSCLYIGGIVLNDVCDVEVDRRERPQRPLPSGQIAVSTARRLAFFLLLAGCLLAAVAGFAPPAEERYGQASAILGVALAAAVVAYDKVLKHTPLFPFAMGLCRFLNVLLGMSAAAIERRPDGAALLFTGFEAHHWMAAGAIGIHIVGVTLFARGEAGKSRRGLLVAGVLVMAAGWTLLAVFPRFAPAEFPWRFRTQQTWYYLLLAMLAIPLFRRCLLAIAQPEPRNVQSAVKQGIWILIWMDTAIVVGAAPPGYSLLVLSLFLPMFLLGRWVYST